MAIEDIIVRYDFITQEENDVLLECQKSLDTRESWQQSNKDNDPNQQWTNRYMAASMLIQAEKGFGKPKDIEIFNLVCDIRERIRKEIIKTYSLDFNVYADSMNLIKWPHGYIQPAHSDFENYNNDPHVYNWREIGCVLYLNDDFDGGQIFFPQHGVEIPVKPRMLAFFPGDVHHSHGVKRVLNGTRYTLSSFWTRHQQKSDKSTENKIG